MAYRPIHTPGELEARLKPGVTREDHWLEFKGLNATTGRPYEKGKDGKHKCRLDVAQFANADGGSIVYGAVEADHLFSNYATVRDPQELVRWLDEVVKSHLEPVPALEARVIRVPTGEEVVVANVPPVLRLVGLRPQDAYEFPIRTVDSRRFLTLTEIEARMQDKERAHRLRLEQIGPDDQVVLDAVVDGNLGHDDWRVSSVTEDTVLLMKAGPNLNVVVPLAYVRAVYRTCDPIATWVIDLSCHVSMHRRQPRIVVTRELPFGRNVGHYRVRGMQDSN